MVGIAYRHDRATGLSVSVWDGEVSAEQRQRHMARLASDPEWGSS
jgi:tellurite resistance protein